jgi:hypothetical protein
VPKWSDVASGRRAQSRKLCARAVRHGHHALLLVRRERALQRRLGSLCAPGDSFDLCSLDRVVRQPARLPGSPSRANSFASTRRQTAWMLSASCARRALSRLDSIASKRPSTASPMNFSTVAP